MANNTITLKSGALLTYDEDFVSIISDGVLITLKPCDVAIERVQHSGDEANDPYRLTNLDNTIDVVLSRDEAVFFSHNVEVADGVVPHKEAGKR